MPAGKLWPIGRTPHPPALAIQQPRQHRCFALTNDQHHKARFGHGGWADLLPHRTDITTTSGG